MLLSVDRLIAALKWDGLFLVDGTAVEAIANLVALIRRSPNYAPASLPMEFVMDGFPPIRPGWILAKSWTLSRRNSVSA
jgi:hypothetical protein